MSNIRLSALLVSSFGTNSILAYDIYSGIFLGIFASGSGLDGPTGIAFGPDGNLYVASYNTKSVLRYDGITGNFIDTFASLSLSPKNLVFGPNGNLYINEGGLVNCYEGLTGNLIGNFVSSRPSGGKLDALSIVFGPDNNLYVSVPFDRVLRFNGTTGDFIDYVGDGGEGAFDITFGPDGRLYETYLDIDAVRKYDLTTNNSLMLIDFRQVFGFIFETSYDPVNADFGPNGDLYVSYGRQDAGTILRFDGRTGDFVQSFASGPAQFGASDGELSDPRDIIFYCCPERMLPKPERERKQFCEVAIDPLSLLLRNDIYIKLKLPDPPPVETLMGRIRDAVKSMGPEDQKNVLARAKALRTYADAIEEELGKRAK